MSNIVLIGIVLFLALLGFIIGRYKVTSQKAKLHSLPKFYGIFVALCSSIPAIVVLGLWTPIAPIAISSGISSYITEEMVPEGGTVGLVMSDVSRIAQGISSASEQGLILPQEVGENVNLGIFSEMLTQSGVILGGELHSDVLSLSLMYHQKSQSFQLYKAIAVLAVAILGLVWGYVKVSPSFWARNRVEKVYLWGLASAAGLAILTTAGIVFSMLFETRNFFGLHSWTDFFFGLSWAPNFHGDSELSILPLLWGTLYISLVALLVAVPIGLFAAIYLSEYASKTIRSFVKPLLEVLAGIPTIVYGLFALITFGPFLKDWFGDGGFLGVNWMGDARSVATAGIVMGFMLIPFVSSLSDDIINAVPQAMRDGSYGLGATQSETIKQVVLPAALPGIVGAILLAASRAIGETMIVVLGAGAIARFTGNPLEALTTITTRIVSQLTGDGDFNSPETLVAFALGLTLFSLTLGLNVLALYIVRKYREQYD